MNSFSYRWQPPAPRPSHFPDLTLWRSSSSMAISTGWLENTCNVNSGVTVVSEFDGMMMNGP